MRQTRVFLSCTSVLLISVSSLNSLPIPDPSRDAVISSRILENSEENQLSKFYRQEYRELPSSPVDSILFPATFSNSETYNRPFADRYNKHRPNIPTPQRSLPFSLAVALPLPDVNGGGNSRFQRQSPNKNNLFTAEQSQILYESLTQLFSGILFRPQDWTNNYRKSFVRPSPTYETVTDATFSTQEFELSDTTDPSDLVGDNSDGVNYQSLYSGPRVQKSPCPNGQHKTHGGSCHGKSRKLKSNR